MIPARDGRVRADLDYNGAPTVEDDFDVLHVAGDLGLPLCGADEGGLEDMPPNGAAFACPACEALDADRGEDG